MNKSAIIIISIGWLLCTMYLTLAKLYDYPYGAYAMIGSWIMSILLLICVIIFIKKHKRK